MKISSKQKGLTLIELMIAMFLGLLVIGSLIQVLIVNHRTNQVQNAVSILQENGRIAIELMSRDIRSADNWGCVNPIFMQRHLSPGDDHYIDIDNGVDGQEGEDGNFDRLILRGANVISDVRVGNQISADAPLPVVGNGTAYIQSYVEDEMGPLIVSDCESADFFMPNSASINQVAHGTDGLSTTYQQNAFLYQPYQIEYFVRDNALFRRLDGNNSDEIADQIEALEILYGEDTDVFPDGTANVFRAYENVADLSRIVSIKINLLFQTEDNIGGGTQRVYFNWEERFGDGEGDPESDLEGLQHAVDDTRIRRYFTATIALRNRIG